jgi:hypothetical protein
VANLPEIPESSPATASTVQPDPIKDPQGFLGDVHGAYRSSQWALLVVLALYGIARLGQWAAAQWKLAWLAGWKLKAVIVAVSVLGSVLVSLGDTGSVDFTALVGAVAAAIALYLQPDRQVDGSLAEPAAPPSADPPTVSAGPVAEPSGDA